MIATARPVMTAALNPATRVDARVVMTGTVIYLARKDMEAWETITKTRGNVAQC